MAGERLLLPLMNWAANLLLFGITVLGGSLPLWLRPLSVKSMQLLLAFSGAFLLGMTLLHLMPESFEELGGKAGIYILGGFFLQLLIQKFTHGAEHGHSHIGHAAAGHEGHDHEVPAFSILAGLAVHAAIEGVPLGFQYREAGTEPALYMAVAAHKLPEAMIVTTMASLIWGRAKGWLTIVLFALITPLAGGLATLLGRHYSAISQLVMVIIPVVAGVFLHIATTIFYESGTRNHHLTWRKGAAIALGVAASLCTLLFHFH